MSATPIQRLLAGISVTEHQYNLQTDDVVQIRALKGRIGRFSRWGLDPGQSHYLTSLGVPHNPEAPGTHSHPTSKTLEEFLLLEEVCPTLNSFGPCYVSSMKNEKFQRLANALTQPSRLENFVVTPKDRLRFGDHTLPPPDGGPTFHEPTALFHFCGHFFTPADIVTLFRNNPGCTNAFFTLVIPPESLFGVPGNQCALYSYQIEGGNLHYAPDGNWSESYSQPVSGSWWLQVGYLQDLDLHLTLQVVRQLGSYFIVHVGRGKTLVRSSGFLALHDAVVLESAQVGLARFPGLALDPIVVPRAAAAFLQGYAESMSRITQVSLQGRLRIWLGEHRWCVMTPEATHALISAVMAHRAESSFFQPSFDGSDLARTFLTAGMLGPYGLLTGVERALRESFGRGNCSPLSKAVNRLALHTKPYHLTSVSPLSPVFSGVYQARDMAEIRSILKAIMFQPGGASFAPLHLVGSADPVSLTQSALRTVIRCSAVNFLAKQARHVPWLRILTRCARWTRKAVDWAGYPLAACCLPTIIYLSPLLPTACFRAYLGLEATLVPKLAFPIRYSWWLFCGASRLCNQLDLAVHSLLLPVDAPLSYHLDPAVAFGLNEATPSPSAPPTAPGPSTPPSESGDSTTEAPSSKGSDCGASETAPSRPPTPPPARGATQPMSRLPEAACSFPDALPGLPLLTEELLASLPEGTGPGPCILTDPSAWSQVVHMLVLIGESRADLRMLEDQADDLFERLSPLEPFDTRRHPEGMFLNWIDSLPHRPAVSSTRTEVLQMPDVLKTSPSADSFIRNSSHMTVYFSAEPRLIPLSNSLVIRSSPLLGAPGFHRHTVIPIPRAHPSAAGKPAGGSPHPNSTKPDSRVPPASRGVVKPIGALKPAVYCFPNSIPGYRLLDVQTALENPGSIDDGAIALNDLPQWSSLLHMAVQLGRNQLDLRLPPDAAGALASALGGLSCLTCTSHSQGVLLTWLDFPGSRPHYSLAMVGLEPQRVLHAPGEWPTGPNLDDLASAPHHMVTYLSLSPNQDPHNASIHVVSTSTAGGWACTAIPFSLVGQGTPELPKQNTCLIDALSQASGFPRERVWEGVRTALGPAKSSLYLWKPFPLGTPELPTIAAALGLRVVAHTQFGQLVFGDGDTVHINHRHNHWYSTTRRNQASLGGSTGRPSRTPKASAPPKHSRAHLESCLLTACGSYQSNYRLSTRRAKAMSEALVEGHEGALLRGKKEFHDQVRSLCDSPPVHVKQNVILTGRLGEPGTGKSYLILELLKLHELRSPRNMDWTIVVATNSLRESILAHLSLGAGRGGMVKTWERALLEPCNPLLILDDAGELPPILDLLLLKSGSKFVAFTGDTCQNVRRVGPACPGAARLIPTLTLLQPGAGLLLQNGKRLPPLVARAFGLATSSTDPGRIFFTITQRGTVLASTPGAAAAMTGLGRRCIPVTQCQGLTVRGPVTLLLDQSMKMASDSAVYTALTRGTGDLHIVESRDKLADLARSHSAILRGLVEYGLSGNPLPLKAAVTSHRLHHTPPHLRDPTRCPGTPPAGDASSIYDGPIVTGSGFVMDSIYRTIRWARQPRTTQPLFVGDLYWASRAPQQSTIRAAMDEVLGFATVLGEWTGEYLASGESPPPPTAPRAQIPEAPPCFLPSDLDLSPTYQLFLYTEKLDELVEAACPNPRLYGRERFFRGALTQQVHQDDLVSALFLHHRRQDKATEQWTYAERYVPPPQRTSLTYYGAGYSLFMAYLTIYNPARTVWSQELFEHSLACDLDALGAKGLKTLHNISYRNEPTLTPGKAEVFLKSQDITKLGSEFRDAKKGQMVTGFNALCNIRFGPFTRCWYALVRSSLPPEILLLNGVTLDEQEAWFQEHWDWSKPTFSDDFVGFDGGQNEEFLCFQAHLARFHEVPPHMVQNYTMFMTHITVLGKESGVWIPSGLKPTWAVNTFDSMAHNALKHKITPHPPWVGVKSGRAKGPARAFSGDDSSQNELITIRPEYERLPHKFKLQSTGCHETWPHFCGTVNYPFGSFSDPTLLLYRVIYKLRRSKLSSSVLSYAEHCYRLHRHLEPAMAYLTSSELACHAKTYRIIRLALLLYSIPLVGSFFVRTIKVFFNLGGKDAEFHEISSPSAEEWEERPGWLRTDFR